MSHAMIWVVTFTRKPVPLQHFQKAPVWFAGHDTPAWTLHVVHHLVSCWPKMTLYYLKQQGRTLCDDDIQNVGAVFGWDPTKSQQRDTLLTVSLTPLSWLFWTDTSTDWAYLGLPKEGELPTERITLNSHGGMGKRCTYIEDNTM